MNPHLILIIFELLVLNKLHIFLIHNLLFPSKVVKFYFIIISFHWTCFESLIQRWSNIDHWRFYITFLQFLQNTITLCFHSDFFTIQNLNFLNICTLVRFVIFYIWRTQQRLFHNRFCVYGRCIWRFKSTLSCLIWCKNLILLFLHANQRIVSDWSTNLTDSRHYFFSKTAWFIYFRLNCLHFNGKYCIIILTIIFVGFGTTNSNIVEAWTDLCLFQNIRKSFSFLYLPFNIF